MSNQAGTTEAGGTKEPRLTLVPARCAVGISASGAGFRVIHTMSGMELGFVARTPELVWGYVPAGTHLVLEPEWATAHAAATALSAHVLDHKLSAIRNQLALAAGGEVA